MITRRKLVGAGGVFLAALATRRAAGQTAPVDIRMQGNSDGSHVWYDPVGLHIEPGRTVRWINLDAGNAHTATAYHPRIMDRPRRIPEKATPWDSDYLLPDETFSVTLTEPGVYDFYCIPHEHAGMVGRIVVGEPPAQGWVDPANEAAGDLLPLPEAALKAFPAVEEILRQGSVRRKT